MKIKVVLLSLSFCIPFFTSCQKTPTYLISAPDSEHLVYSTLAGKSLDGCSIKEQDSLTFRVKAINNTNDIIYIVPIHFNITINGGPPLTSEFYTVERDETYENAVVTVDKTKIVGDVSISADVGQVGYFNYDIPYHFGVTSDVGYSGFYFINEDLVINFTPEKGRILPEAENIYISIDNGEWFNPNNETNGATYSNGKLTITKNSVKSYLSIILQSYDYNLLNELTWKQINDYSFVGLSKYLFYCGQSKTFTINNIEHSARIIGFDHDYLTGTDKQYTAGLTFELETTIAKPDGNPYEENWGPRGTRSCYFANSNFNKLLNDEKEGIYGAFDNNIRPYIKQVDKLVATGENYTPTEYHAFLFPLSYIELNCPEHAPTPPAVYSTEEGTPYLYYQLHSGLEDRIKKDLNGNDRYYWTRSPQINEKTYYQRAGAICPVGDSRGKVETYFVCGSQAAIKASICAAFCI